MMWLDNGVFLNTYYYKVKADINTNALVKSVGNLRKKYTDLFKQNGVFMTINNIVIYNDNYLLLNILSLEDEIDFITKNINLLGVDDYQEIQPIKSVFQFLMRELNNVRYSKKSNDSIKEAIDWKDMPVQKEDYIKNIDYLPIYNQEIDDGCKQAFVGYVADIKYSTNLKSLIILNLIKFAIGENKMGDAYYDLRKHGNIYSSMTKVFAESNSILSGCFCSYKRENHENIDQAIIKKVESLIKNTTYFNEIKHKYISSLRIANLDSHWGYLLEPYSRYAGKEISFDHLIEYIYDLTKEDVASILDELNVMDVCIDMESRIDD